jgi:hypothetical protein
MSQDTSVSLSVHLHPHIAPYRQFGTPPPSKLATLFMDGPLWYPFMQKWFLDEFLQNESLCSMYYSVTENVICIIT